MFFYPAGWNVENSELFHARSRAAAAVFFFLFAVIAVRALQIGVISRERFLRAGEKLSLKSVTIPARRGSILDQNNVPLAWSERHFELWSALPAGEHFSPRQQEKLREIFPHRVFSAVTGGSSVLCLRLTAREIAALEPLIRRGFPLKIRSKTRRLTVNSAELEKQLGSVRNGVGISGWEQRFDHLLQGRDGKGRVMLDRRRNWIHSTWRMTVSPVHGRNVVVPVTFRKAGKDAQK